MSRLDYVTVGIVAVCLAALGFLVFKTVGLMNGEADTETPTEYANPDPIDTTRYDTSGFTDPAFSSTDEDLDDSQVDAYSEEDDLGKSKVTDKKTTTTSKGATEPTKKTETKTTPEKKKETPPTTAEKSNSTTTSKGATTPKTATKTTPKAASKSDDDGGTYAVQAGAFKARINAEALVKELKKLGYSDAEVAISNGGALAVAVVERFSSYEEAAALVKTLKSKHNIDALVKRK